MLLIEIVKVKFQIYLFIIAEGKSNSSRTNVGSFEHKSQ